MFANKIHALLADQGITRRVKPLSKAGRDFLSGLPLPKPWNGLLSAYLSVIDSLTAEIDALDDRIEDRASTSEETQLLMTIPGISHYSVLVIDAELGEIDRFDTAKQVVRYVGLNPVIRESGDSRFEGSISKKGSGTVR